MENKKKYLVPAIVIICVIAAIASPFMLTQNWCSKIASFNNTGQIGDTIGGTTAPILSLITIYLVYLTYTSQKKELEETQKALNKQQFESSFFQMLNMLNQITLTSKTIGLLNDKTSKEGIDYFDEVLFRINSMLVLKEKWNIYGFDLRTIENNRIINEVDNIKLAAQGSPGDKIQHADILLSVINEKLGEAKMREYVELIYLTNYKKEQKHLSHFFRYIYNTIKYVESQVKEEEQRLRYINLIQAQLSNDQLGLIFYNCLSNVSKDKNGISIFYNCIDKYQFLQNMDSSCIADNCLIKFYPNTKFKFVNENES